MSTRETVLDFRDDLEQGRLFRSEVAARMGVSRERVRQLCVKLKIAVLRPVLCSKCGCRLTVAERELRSPLARQQETHSWYCRACLPHRKALSTVCAQCEQVYVLLGRARSGYLQNKNGRHKVQRARCRDCKAAAKGYRDILLVPCADCGTEVQYRRHHLNQRLRAGKGAVCRLCVMRHQEEGRRRSRLLRMQGQGSVAAV